MWYIKENKITSVDVESKTKEFLEKSWNQLVCSDIVMSNTSENIQIVRWVNKPKTDFRTKQLVKPKWLPVVTHTITNGQFNFSFDIDSNNFLEYLGEYSKILIEREERIIKNIWSWLNTDLISKLRKLHEDWKYPIKIGMFKKSLSYKLYWEDLLTTVYTKKNQKSWKMDMDSDKALRIWVWDKSIYCNESNTPVWRILLSLKQ